jgi:hypothetical protein
MIFFLKNYSKLPILVGLKDEVQQKLMIDVGVPELTLTYGLRMVEK